MKTLSEVLQAPDPVNLEKFLSRLPIIFNVAIFSVHGYFGQADVLGLPDTGGQVKFLTSAATSLIIIIGCGKVNRFLYQINAKFFVGYFLCN